MKTFSASAIAAFVGAAMVLPLAAGPAAAQVPAGSYLRSCRDVQMRGDRLVATCRTKEGRWNRTALDDIGRCASAITNSDGRLVCGTRGGGFNVGSERPRGWDGYGWRGEPGGYGGSYWPRGGDRWYGGPEYGWGPGYYYGR